MTRLPFKIALCNEVVRELEFARQCALAVKLGYAGLEIAPFTLAEDAYRMAAPRRAELRRALADHGLVCSGLHWLLASPAGLSITTSDKTRYERTRDVMRALIELCADLGGGYLVHGSPQQRILAGEADPHAAWERAIAAWQTAAVAAADADVVYLIEPLARAGSGQFGTDFVNTVAEASAIIDRSRLAALKTMIDTCAAANAEALAIPDLIRQSMPTGHVAHIHLNDRNRRGPGEGDDRFGPVLQALVDTGYSGWLGIEPFVYEPDGPTCAARAIGYLQGLAEGLR